MKIPDLGDHALEPAPEEVHAHRGVNDGRGRVLFLQLCPPSHRSDARLPAPDLQCSGRSLLVGVLVGGLTLLRLFLGRLLASERWEGGQS